MFDLTEEVALTTSTTEARLIVGILEANGIRARASADDAGGLEPQWQLTEGVRVFVASEDAAEAQRLVAEATSGPEWPTPEPSDPASTRRPAVRPRSRAKASSP